MNIRQNLLAQFFACILTGVIPAEAADIGGQDREGLDIYLSIAGGWSHADSADFEVPAVAVSGEIFFKEGWVGTVALGANLSDHVRAEIEFAAHDNALDYENLTGLGTIDLSGQTRVYDGLAKLSYSFGDGPLRPYVGVGLGLASFDVTIDSPVTGKDSDVVFAGAVEGGVGYAIASNVDLFFNSQLLVLDDVSLDPASTGAVAKLSHPLLVSTSLGMRWNF